ncbi:MAG: glycosyltransferase family 4 protein [Deltaproteobacteria bacterium]|nr:glycosyltransferase family 4 protein [Deltaproteobacteria bacterium]
MKVALLCENYYPTLGGIQEHVYHLAQGLRRVGVDAKVITGLPRVKQWRGPRDEDWVLRVGSGTRYGALGTASASTFGPRVAWNLHKTLARERFDLVHVHGPSDVGLPVLLYLLSNLPTIATLHSPMNDMARVRRLFRGFYRWSMARHQAVIAVSEAARLAMGKLVTFDSEVIPNGVDVRAMSSGKPMQRYRDGKFNILMLGRLEPRNGPDLMFNALPEILKVHPDVRLLVAGEEKPSGTERHKAMVPQAARDNVVFLGSVFEERPDVYATADLCVLPARAGTFSIILLEALAAGKPVVATPFVQACRKDKHWATVTLSDDISTESLVRALVPAIAEAKRDGASERVRQGREIVQAFDWSAVCGKVLGVYERVLGWPSTALAVNFPKTCETHAGLRR